MTEDERDANNAEVDRRIAVVERQRRLAAFLNAEGYDVRAGILAAHVGRMCDVLADTMVGVREHEAPEAPEATGPTGGHATCHGCHRRWRFDDDGTGRGPDACPSCGDDRMSLMWDVVTT